MVARDGVEPPPAFLGLRFAGGELAAPFMLPPSYRRRKAITFLDLLRLSPFLVDKLFLNCACKCCWQFLHWRHREENPCKTEA